MYDKTSGYRGTTEFQFEEIRLANIRARQRQMLERQLEEERERSWSWSVLCARREKPADHGATAKEKSSAAGNECQLREKLSLSPLCSFGNHFGMLPCSSAILDGTNQSGVAGAPSKPNITVCTEVNL
ncbi:hypothetical protein MTO96_047835 [Rhipicephalus appendiculatus]